MAKVLACIGMMLTLAIAAFAQAPANLVQNPSMEAVTTEGFAAGWRGGECGKPVKNVTIDEKVAHSGKNSIRVSTSLGSFVTCAGADVPVKP